MFFLRRPSAATIARSLDAQRPLAFSYPEQGRSRDAEPPPGYPLNRWSVEVGRGEGRFEEAVGALRRWAMYDLPWTELFPAGAPVRAGTDVTVLVRHLGFWSLNPARIVYVDDPVPGRPLFQFALGTLPGHSEHGEERFRVDLSPDGAVRFSIDSFAGPQHPLATLGYPVMRLLQRRFAREAGGRI